MTRLTENVLQLALAVVVAVLLDYLSDRFGHYPALAYFATGSVVLLALLTLAGGLRMGEAVRLAWDDIRSKPAGFFWLVVAVFVTRFILDLVG